MNISYEVKQVLKMVAFALLPLFTIKYSIQFGGWEFMATPKMLALFIVSAIIAILGVAKALHKMDRRRGISHQ